MCLSATAYADSTVGVRVPCIRVHGGLALGPRQTAGGSGSPTS